MDDNAKPHRAGAMTPRLKRRLQKSCLGDYGRQGKLLALTCDILEETLHQKWNTILVLQRQIQSLIPSVNNARTSLETDRTLYEHYQHYKMSAMFGIRMIDVACCDFQSVS